MTPSRRIAAISLLSIMLGAVLGLGSPKAAQAEKLPVDCSGRRTDCFSSRTCTEWVDHRCIEITSRFWYWYF
jgi:hypothetical protein